MKIRNYLVLLSAIAGILLSQTILVYCRDAANNGVSADIVYQTPFGFFGWLIILSFVLSFLVILTGKLRVPLIISIVLCYLPFFANWCGLLNFDIGIGGGLAILLSYISYVILGICSCSRYLEEHLLRIS